MFEPKKYNEKIFKNLLKDHLAYMLEIWYVAFPSGPLPRVVCSNEDPRFEDGPAPGGPRFKP